MQPNRRSARVKELLKQQVAECIRQELTINEVGLLTVNDVGIASDLKSATVFLGFVGTPAQRLAAPAKLAEDTRATATLECPLNAASRNRATSTCAPSTRAP